MPHASPKDWSPHDKDKKRWVVLVREVHIQEVEVMAHSEAEAIQRVAEGEGSQVTSEGDLEYSHTLDPDTWTAEVAE